MISLKFLDFEASSYCGAECLMCPQKKSKYKNHIMSFDIFEKALCEAADKFGLESIRFCGLGEPFLDDGLIVKLKYLKEKFPHISVSVTTTLHVYNENTMPYIDSIYISHYGASKRVYELIHGGSLNYENVVNNIESVLSLSDDKRPYITMSFLELPQNADEKEQWMDKWKNKVDEIMIWKPHNWGGRALT